MKTLSMRGVNYQIIASQITGFILDKVEDAKAKGVVVGLSGGIDSSVVATLCVKALSKRSVLGLIMPESFTPSVDVSDAKILARELDISNYEIDIHPIIQVIKK